MKYNTHEQCSNLEDVLMNVAALGLLEIEGQKLLAESKQLNKRPNMVPLAHNMEKLLEQRLWHQRQKDHIRSFGRAVRPVFVHVAVCFFVICLGAGSVLTVSAEARKALYEFLISEHERYMEVQLDPNMAIHFDHLEKYKAAGCEYAPTYVPAGVSLQEIDPGMYTIIANYSNGDEKDPLLCFSQKNEKSSGHTRLDSENLDHFEIIMIGDSEGILRVKKGYTGITWFIGDTLLYVGTDLPTDEAILFAKGVKKI